MTRLAAALVLFLIATVGVSSAQAAFFIVQPDGRTMHVLGSFTPYDAPAFADVVAENGGIEAVILTSDGGSMNAAIAIGRYIYEHNLKVTVEGYCLSACAFTWLAGRRGGLIVESGALVGVHAPFTDSQANVTIESVAVGAWYLGTIGAPQPLIFDIMRATPPDNGLTDFLPILAREHIGITTVSPPVLAAQKMGPVVPAAIMASISDY